MLFGFLNFLEISEKFGHFSGSSFASNPNFQVLPSKLRSSSVESNLSNSTFLDHYSSNAMVVQDDTDHDRDTIDNEAEDDLLGAGKDDLDDQNDVRENTVQIRQF